jgi:hypothetical protein
MNENFTYWSDLVDKKLQNRLSEQDNVQFELLISQNTDFQKFYEQQKQLAFGIKLAERQRLKDSLKMQLQQENKPVSGSAKSRFSYIFWLSQYSAAIWLVTISIVIALSSVLLYRTWQLQQQKKQLALQWQKAEELLEEPNKKQEIVISKPNSPHTQHNTSPSQKESTVIPLKPSPKENLYLTRAEKNMEKQRDTDKEVLFENNVLSKKEKQEVLADDLIKEEKTKIEEENKTEKTILQNSVVSPIAGMEDDIKPNDKKKAERLQKEDAKQKSNIREFYLPVYALRIQDEVQNKNHTATPENIRSGKEMPRSTKSTVGPKVFITQYTDKKVQENNIWYYDFNRDGSGEHLFMYADFDIQSLTLYTDRNPSPTKYYLKTKKGVFVLYPNQTQKLAELLTDKNILKHIE